MRRNRFWRECVYTVVTLILGYMEVFFFTSPRARGLACTWGHGEPITTARFSAEQCDVCCTNVYVFLKHHLCKLKVFPSGGTCQVDCRGFNFPFFLFPLPKMHDQQGMFVESVIHTFSMFSVCVNAALVTVKTCVGIMC